MKKLVLGQTLSGKMMAVVVVADYMQKGFDAVFESQMSEALKGSDEAVEVVFESDLESFVSEPLTFYGQKECTSDNTYLFVWESSGHSPSIMPVAANSPELATERFKLFAKEQPAEIKTLFVTPLSQLV